MTEQLNDEAAVAAGLAGEAVGLSGEDLLLWAGQRFEGRLAFATSLGLEDQVLTDLIVRSGANIPLFTIDTGKLPEQTLRLIEQTERRYSLEIEVLRPDAEEVRKMTRRHGPAPYYTSVALRKLCCHVRKVAVLRRRLAGLDAWVCGLRREQSVTREDVDTVQWDGANRLVKINPLADWTLDRVWTYIRKHDVPYNALHDESYPSIGCLPCTRAVLAGRDIRSGRWWWEEPEQKECGLHVVQGRLVRKK